MLIDPEIGVKMLTLFRTKYGEYEGIDDEYTKNEFFTFFLDDTNILITTRHRAWVILNGTEYEMFLEKKLDLNPDLYSLLESLGIILTRRNLQATEQLYYGRYGYLCSSPKLVTIFLALEGRRDDSIELVEEKDSSRRMSKEIGIKAIDFSLSIPQIDKPVFIEFRDIRCSDDLSFVMSLIDYGHQQAAKMGSRLCFRLRMDLRFITEKILNQIACGKEIEVHIIPDVLLSDSDYPLHKVKYWITRLLESQIPFKFLPMISKEPAKIIEFIDTCIDLDSCCLLDLKTLNTMGNCYWPPLEVQENEPGRYFETWKQIFEHVLTLNVNGRVIPEFLSISFLANILSPDFGWMCIARPCGCSISQLAISSDGKIYGCDGGLGIDMLYLGDVLEHDYDEIITSETARLLRTLIPEALPQCDSCCFSPYCGHCLARYIIEHQHPVFAPSGDFECILYKRILSHLFRQFLNPTVASIMDSWIS